jgi:general secretion pathway protein H
MEILLVLVISALILSLAPAMIQKAFPRLKLKGAVRDLVQEIRYVQNAAIINGQKAEIAFDVEHSRYRSDLVNQGEVRSLPEGIAFYRAEAQSLSDSNSATAFNFYPDGSSSGGEILLAIEQHRLRISVDWLTSKVQVDDLQAAR